MKKTRAIIIVALFAAFIFGFGIIQFLLPDAEVSYSERRRLEQAPELTADSIFSGGYMDRLDKYMLDQFPLRDGFRSIKALLRYDVFRQLDNNDIYIVGDTVAKLDKTLNEKQVLYGMDKISGVCETYLKDSRIIMSLVPDKSYFLAAENGYPHLDYDRLVALVTDNLPEGAEYVNIFDTLSVSDYYRTDAHWRQERVYPAALRLAGALGVADAMPDESAFSQNRLYPFYGVYYGQSALPLKADDIVYLTDPAISAAKVTGAELDGEKPVYDESQLQGMDGYNVFLHGPQSILTIENPDAATDKELIIFRDSFGSSLAPLFVDAYSKVTLIDLRYVSSALLGEYVEFTGQDVLFIYSTTLMNTAMLLK